MRSVFKVLGVIALVAVIGFGFISCGGDDGGGGGGTTVKVTGVTLNKTYLILAVGDSEKLIATVTPDNATNKAVTWSLRDTLNPIVSVSADGTVTALSEGVTNITVCTEDGGFSERCTVDIRAAAPANADVSINLEAEYSGTGADTYHWVTIYLSLPSGAKWTLPKDEDDEITGAQALAAVKSWVTITSSTTPAITGWNFESWYDNDSEIELCYYFDGTGVSRSAVSAQIVQSKVSEMKSYTNVAGTLTASTGTVTKNWHN